MTPILALEDIRVVDLSRYLAGPAMTMHLADLGADVVKVEGLPRGDPARSSGPFDREESVYYLASNRNKRSLAVDLRAPKGREIVYRLIHRADVVVQNFRPGLADKMGFGYEEVAARNPRVVYCNISGFGMEGPGAALPGFDQTAQAMSGLMSVTGTETTGPLRAGIAVADTSTGAFAAVGVLAALFMRERTGVGQRVDASLMESMLTLMSYQAQKYLSLGELPGMDGNDHPLMFPQGTFRARDGDLTLASGNDRMWQQLCGVLGLDELVSDSRFIDNASRMVNRAELRRLIERALQERDVSEWLPAINAAGIPCSPVLDLKQALEHPITDALQMVNIVQHTVLGPLKVLGRAAKLDGAQEGWLRLPPPLLGEHSVEVCREVGYTPAEIGRLLKDGTIRGKTAADASSAAEPA